MNQAHPGEPTGGIDNAPPVYLAGGFAVGVLLDRILPFRLGPKWARLALGLPLIGAGALLWIWAVETMTRAGTSPEPWRPTTTVVSRGPFRISRNPIYVSYLAGYLGVSVLSNKLWPVLTLLPAMIALYRRVVQREEADLERKFGDEYRAYKRRVRRWL